MRCLVLLAFVSSAAASPRTAVEAEVLYTHGSVIDMTAYQARIAAAHAVRPALTLSASFSVVRVSTESEGETLSDNAVSNPTLRVRYARRPTDALELGVATGFTPGLGDGRDPAKLAYAGIA